MEGSSLHEEHKRLGVHLRSFSKTHKREALGVPRTSLDQELIPPAIKCLETLVVVHVVDQDTAVGSPVEGHTQ